MRAYEDKAPLILDVELEYAGKRYRFQEDCGNYTYAGADYIWREGNYSCDCNRSLFIARRCPESADFPDMECGETIKLIALKDKATGEEIGSCWT